MAFVDLHAEILEEFASRSSCDTSEYESSLSTDTDTARALWYQDSPERVVYNASYAQLPRVKEKKNVSQRSAYALDPAFRAKKIAYAVDRKKAVKMGMTVAEYRAMKEST